MGIASSTTGSQVIKAWTERSLRSPDRLDNPSRNKCRPERQAGRNGTHADGDHDSPARGSAQWVRDQLNPHDPGSHTKVTSELTNWIYTVVRRRASTSGLVVEDRADIVQDAMLQIHRAINGSQPSFTSADNPAAMIEHAAARAVSASKHRIRMCGLCGVAPNGQNWHARYPQRIGGDTGTRILGQLTEPRHAACRETEAAAARLATWVSLHIGVVLTVDARHAVIYVLDRLAAGVRRSSLLRGSHSALATDPAMRHLGFTPRAAAAFAAWLLGRSHCGEVAASVLDAALLGEQFEETDTTQWRLRALEFGFASKPYVGRPS